MPRRLSIPLGLTLALLPGAAPASQPSRAAPPDPIQRDYQSIASRIIAAATADSSAWNTLAELTDGFGSRLSGSDALEHAIDWIETRMKDDGPETVHTEPVMVPHWVRGNEKAELVEPRRANLPMLGLGGSVAPPKDGVQAEGLGVSSFDDLKTHAADAPGEIVLFAVPFTRYGQH